MLFALLLWGFQADVARDLSCEPTRPMTAQAYADWLLDHEPLDRLYRRDDLIYFLNPDLPPAGACMTAEKNDANGAFHGADEAQDLLRELAAAYPDLARLTVMGTTEEGRNINVLAVGSGAAEAPNLLVVGCHHAREWISVEVPLLFAQYLLEAYDHDERIRALMDQVRFHIVPVFNPDGLAFSIYEYRFWRKNRRYLGELQWGVDLNRNFAYAWGVDDVGSSNEPSSNLYRGPAPMSERESAALAEYLAAYPPTAAVSYHNYSQSILYPWGHTETPSPGNAELALLAEGMAESMAQVHGRVYATGQSSNQLYLTNGDFIDWIYGTWGVPALLIELPPEFTREGGFVTSEEEIELSFSENLAGLLFWAEQFVPSYFALPMPEGNRIRFQPENRSQ